MGRSLIAASLLLLPLTGLPIAASAQQQAQQEDPSRIVCRSERPTGSRIASRRTCRTAAEWASQARVIREALDSRANRPVEGTSDAAPTIGGGPTSPFVPPRS
jgi:hypothetical protein